MVLFDWLLGKNTTRWRLVQLLADLDDPAAVRPLINALQDQRISKYALQGLKAKLARPGTIPPSDLQALAIVPDSMPYREGPRDCVELRGLARNRLAGKGGESVPR